MNPIELLFSALPVWRPVVTDLTGRAPLAALRATHQLVNRHGPDLFPYLVHAQWRGDLFVMDFTGTSNSRTLNVEHRSEAERYLGMALDRCSDHGEGVIILPGTPFDVQSSMFDVQCSALPSQLFDRCWLRVDLEDGREALFFAKGHNGGPIRRSLALLRLPGKGREAREFRKGLTPSPAFTTEDSVERWRVARSGLTDRKPHLSLVDGVLDVHVSAFDAARLDVAPIRALDGRRLEHLVMERTTRTLLQKLVAGPPWRCTAGVAEALAVALRDLQMHRAPLAPLGPGVRLGWLDEHDSLVCRRDDPPRFRAGRRYEMTAQPVFITRSGTVRTMAGSIEDVSRTGRETCYLVMDDRGEPNAFRTQHANEMEVVDELGVVEQRPPRALAELLAHFEIPAVPDIATLQPARYQEMRDRLKQLEELSQQL